MRGLRAVSVLMGGLLCSSGCLWNAFELGCCIARGVTYGAATRTNNTLRCDYEEKLAITSARERDFTRSRESLQFLANYCDHQRMVRATAVYDEQLQLQARVDKLRRCPAVMERLQVSWRHPGFALQAQQVRQACLPLTVDEEIGMRSMDLEVECQHRAEQIRQDHARGDDGAATASRCLYLRGQCAPEEVAALCGDP